MGHANLHSGMASKKRAIVKAIENGKLTSVDMVSRLTNLVDEEISKSQPDMSLIQATLDLLARLQSEKYTSDIEQSKKCLSQYLQRRKKRSEITKKACFVVAVLAIAFAVDLLGHGEWLDGQTIDQGQIYEVSGSDFDAGLLRKGNADIESLAPKTIRSNSLPEIEKFLGYKPSTPLYLPDGVYPEEYWASTSFISNEFRIEYHVGNGYLTYIQTIYTEPEYCQISFEQNSSGKEVEINGKHVYLTQNVEDIVLIWLDKLTCHMLSGNLPLAEMVKMMAEL